MRQQRGDTLIEVIAAVTVFSLVAVGSLLLMNQGTAMAQRSLEIGLVRNQMDAQADALRYLHNAYIASQKQEDTTATTLWKDVVVKHAVATEQKFGDMADDGRCQLPAPSPFGTGSDGLPFVVDTKKLDGDKGNPVVLFDAVPAGGAVPVSVRSGLALPDDALATTYAQVRHLPRPDGSLQAVSQGMWIQGVYTRADGDTLGYYDFHIRACWTTPGQDVPMTLGTVVRLYDPNE